MPTRLFAGSKRSRTAAAWTRRRRRASPEGWGQCRDWGEVDSRARGIVAIDGALACAPAHFTPAAWTIAQGAIAHIAPSLDDDDFDLEGEGESAALRPPSAGHAPCHCAGSPRFARRPAAQGTRPDEMIDDAGVLDRRGTESSARTGAAQARRCARRRPLLVVTGGVLTARANGAWAGATRGRTATSCRGARIHVTTAPGTTTPSG